jgi:hypothetical protein
VLGKLVPMRASPMNDVLVGWDASSSYSPSLTTMLGAAAVGNLPGE